MDKSLIISTSIVVIVTTIVGAQFFVHSKVPEFALSSVPSKSIVSRNSNNSSNNNSNISSIGTSVASAAEIPIDVNTNIPILMYHAIDNGPNDLYLNTYHFEQHVANLVQNNYSFITFEDLQKGMVPKKPVIITFDDGYESLYTNAYPILKKYNAKATVFLISNYIGKKLYLNPQEIHEMNDIVSFQSHTATHSDLRKLKVDEIDKEAKSSKETIQQLVSNKVIAYCYPAGKYNNDVLNVTAKYYSYGLTTNLGVYHINNNPYIITRIRIDKTDTGEVFIKKLSRFKL